MYRDSTFGLLNSFKNAFLISTKVLTYIVGMVLYKFIYHTSRQLLEVVANCAIFTTSSAMFFVAQIVLQTNKCCSVSFDPIPWNSGNLRVLSTLTMFFDVVPPLGDAI
jgi:hypothetical protein